MCQPNVIYRDQVQKLSVDDRDALREFAKKRLDKATEDEARLFWQTLVTFCYGDDEWHQHLERLSRYNPEA